MFMNSTCGSSSSIDHVGGNLQVPLWEPQKKGRRANGVGKKWWVERGGRGYGRVQNGKWKRNKSNGKQPKKRNKGCEINEIWLHGWNTNNLKHEVWQMDEEALLIESINHKHVI